MTWELNTNYYLCTTDDMEPLPVDVNLICQDGEIHFFGPVDSVQPLLEIGTKFNIIQKGTKGSVVIGEIVRIIDKVVHNPVAGSSDSSAMIFLELESMCKITYCKWFEVL
jgi:hypothetical protein